MIKSKYFFEFFISSWSKFGYKLENIVLNDLSILFPTLQFYTLNYGYDTYTVLLYFMNLSKLNFKKIIYMILGIISFSLGAIGIIIPGLPTTPFMILSSILFLRSSDRMYKWLINHPRFGKYVLDFKKGKGITFKTKIYAQTMMLVTVTLSLIPISPMFIDNPAIRIVLFASGIFSFWLVGFKIPTNKSHVNEPNKK
jgi:uncharacterized membrane protein YbaN (DUF454 family)